MKYVIFIVISFQLFGQSFEENVLQFIEKEYPEYDKVEIQFIKDFLPGEKITLDYTRKIILGKGTAIVPVIAVKNNKTSATIISVKLRLYKKTLIALRDFSRKDILQNSWFEEKITDITFLNGNTVSSKTGLNRYRAKSTIKKGDILLEETIENIPLVNSGDKVLAEVRNGSVIITTEATARQTGYRGDIIEIVAFENRIIKAKVFDEYKVIVE